MSNRVDELEGQVAELRAAVNGLTEELVETKDRLRKLEAEAASEAEPPAERETKSDDHVVVVEQEQDDVDVATDSLEADATSEGEPSESAVEPEETTENDTNGSTDDIIVA
jgi:multidrug resistance efflux pump